MDELTLLRNACSDVPPPSEAALTNARAALFDRIALEVDPGARAARVRAAGRTRRLVRHRPWRSAGFAGIGTVAAAGLIATLVMTNVVGLAGWRGGADAAAAAVLQEASIAAIRNADPVIAPGQYLKVETTAVYGATVVDEDGTAASYLTITDEDLFIPADRGDEWIWLRPLSRPYQTFGPESERFAAASWESVVAERGEDYVERLRAPGGEFYGSPNLNDPESLADLPRDPHRLLNYIYRTTIGQGPSPDGEALVWIADRLRIGAIPADLRAAMYQAAALIPGVTVTEEQANLNGRTGIAIGRLEGANGLRQDLIIDPDTGLLIGEREVLVEDPGDSTFPVGTAIAWTAVETSVVDAAPAGGTPNGALDDDGCTSTGNGSFACPSS
ncbi:CU044_5270 family protein [Agromyces binzhouensis]|uniref:CU044_5270 family protein n=1 Tax=Agromyces binzhouensis TaxID=1817495 RepID=UPI0036419B3D